MSMFKRIDHVEIVTDKLEPSVAFYTEVLGFTVGARDRIERPGGGILNIVYLGLGGTTVELMSYDGVAVAPQPEMEHLGYRMMALEVEDMKDALALLKAKGVEAAWGPVFRENYARAEICDPNGYRIELRHWF
jgi:catechol 2,3-dioxygenase-like lactoylglutathione lyase family enzyme